MASVTRDCELQPGASSSPVTQPKLASELGQPVPTYITVSSVFPMPQVVATSVPPGTNDAPRSPTTALLGLALMPKTAHVS